MKALEDKDPEFRKAIIEVLERTDDIYAVEPLIKLLKDKNSDIHQICCKTPSNPV